MQRLLTGPVGLACLAAALLAHPGFAFQQTHEQPETTRPETKHESTHGGMFDSFGQGYIRMNIEGGKSHLHNITEETRVFIDGEPARMGNLKTGDRIEVTMGPNNVAMKIDVIRNAARQGAARPDFEEQPQGQGEVQAQAKITPWLGVVLNKAEEGKQGVEIRHIFPSGPAARAGLRSGDMLIQFEGKDVASPEDVAKLIAEGKVDEPIEVVVLRGEERFPIKTALANRSDFLLDGPFSNDGQGQDGFGEFDHSHVPDHAMMLEQHRNFAEQHERIEMKLDQVLKELADLRKQMGHVPTVEGPETVAPRPDVQRNPAIEERLEVPSPEVPDRETEAIKPETEIPEAPKP
jgi:hypothetical protein